MDDNDRRIAVLAIIAAVVCFLGMVRCEMDKNRMYFESVKAASTQPAYDPRTQPF